MLIHSYVLIPTSYDKKYSVVSQNKQISIYIDKLHK